MGQSQMLIIAISVLIIGIAIAAGAGFFSDEETEANKKIGRASCRERV